MSILELEHNNKKYRLRILKQEPMSELEVKKNYVGELYKNINNEYFRLQVEDSDFIGPGVSLAYSDILIISPELCEKIKQLYPNLVLVQTGIYTWKVEFKAKETGDKVSTVGHVNLLR